MQVKKKKPKNRGAGLGLRQILWRLV